MSLWDEAFLAKCNKLGIKVNLYKRYVDDVVMICAGTGEGWGYDRNLDKMVYSPNVGGAGESEEARTFRVIGEVANTLDHNIQMEVDHPELHDNGKLPVLNLQMWTECGQVMYTFYQKPCSTPYVIQYRSAISATTKRSSLFQEGMRRWQNMAPSLPNEAKCEVLTKFMHTLMVSGYDQAYRYSLIQGIMKRVGEVEA